MKPEQLRVVEAFLQGHDVLQYYIGCLCYEYLPLLEFDKRMNTEFDHSFIVVVMTPLTAIRKEIRYFTIPTVLIPYCSIRY